MTKEDVKKHVSEVMKRKHYERIIEGANKSFQDLSIMIARLPDNQLEKIEFEGGLRLLHNSLAKKGLTERTPFRAIEEAQNNMDACMDIIQKYNKNLMKIAEPDFNAIKEWLTVIQKFPKPQGADF